MERLTWTDVYDGIYADMDGNQVQDYDTNSVLTGNVVEKLAAYEDTGLEPEQVMDILTLTDWVQVDKRLPRREEWIGTRGNDHYLRRLEIAVKSDTLEYFLVFYDGYKWFDKFGRTYAGVVAWKIHESYNPQN